MSTVFPQRIATDKDYPQATSGGELLTTSQRTMLNDIHSQLNPTCVRGIISPRSVDELCAIIRRAREAGLQVSLSGGMHAMGGQQFGTTSLQIDMRSMNRVVHFEPEKQLIEVEAGIQWPELIDYTVSAQLGGSSQLGISQKQTGADNLTIGGSLSANIHGRGLASRPFIADIESFVLIDYEGRERVCSRELNPQLFRLCIGGYGLFGVVASVKLRLVPRRKLVRVVEIANLADVTTLFQRRIDEGCLYGDFQYATDHSSEEFLKRGVFSCYKPISDGAPMNSKQRELSPDAWRELLYLAHTDRKRAFEVYSQHYLQTSGQTYWSDTHQLSVYIDDYHCDINRRMGRSAQASEMITECFVPRDQLASFMESVRRDFLSHNTEVIYGTVRLILKDEESFLAWAKQDYACVIFNLHVDHIPVAIEESKAAFLRLIDRAIEHGGSYYLTYHRWARRDQVEACYPQLPDFLNRKKQHDPAELFQSDWYRHYRRMYGG